MMSIIVNLSKDEVRVCTLLAVERWLTKFGSKDKPNYAQGKIDGKLEPEINEGLRETIQKLIKKSYGR